MAGVEAVFLWAAVWLYGMSFLSFLYGMVFKRDRWMGRGWHLALLGFASHTASMGVRWGITGHPPVMKVYENSILGSWFLLLTFVIIRSWHKKIEAIGIAIMPLALLTIGNGVMSDPFHQSLSPPYQSNWMWLHAIFAWAAYGAFLVAAGLGIIYLLKERANAPSTETSFYDRLPDLRVLNDLMLKLLIFGFISLTVEVGAGAIWAYGLWGRYWGWDPIETWSLITWLIYGIDIHLGVTLGWKGKRMAWLAILSLISLFITFGGIGYFKGVHTIVL